MKTKKTLEQRFIDAKIALIMETPDDELDEVLVAAGFDPNDLIQRGNKAIEGVLTSLKEDVDLISNLPLPKKKEVVRQLGISHGVLTAIAERRAIFESIPKRFIRALAESIGVSIESMVQSLNGSVRKAYASHKSDKPPIPPTQVAFEKLLKDAAISEERIRTLLEEDV